MVKEYCIIHWSKFGDEPWRKSKVRYYQSKDRMMRELPTRLESEYNNWKFKTEVLEREVSEWKELS